MQARVQVIDLSELVQLLALVDLMEKIEEMQELTGFFRAMSMMSRMMEIDSREENEEILGFLTPILGEKADAQYTESADNVAKELKEVASIARVSHALSPFCEKSRNFRDSLYTIYSNRTQENAKNTAKGKEKPAQVEFEKEEPESRASFGMR